MKRKLTLILLVTFCFFFCSEDKDIPLPTLTLPKLKKINKIQLELRNQDSKVDDKVIIVMQDYDEINKGKEAATGIEGKLKPNSSYYGYAQIMYEYNEKKYTNFNKDILKEGTQYLFFMNTDNKKLATFKAYDNDVHGNPIGISFILTTGKPGEKGIIGFTLSSVLDKNKAIIDQGKIKNTKSEIHFFAHASWEL